jgi:hypothetical protein
MTGEVEAPVPYCEAERPWVWEDETDEVREWGWGERSETSPGRMTGEVEAPVPYCEAERPWVWEDETDEVREWGRERWPKR